ncbi:MAG: diguanylate cyclase [Acidaminococcaceae bacterium]
MRKKILSVTAKEESKTWLRENFAEDYDLLEATNGEVALELLTQEQNEIICILLDLVLPSMTGQKFLKHLQKLEQEQVPVIILSSPGNEVAEVKALGIGASAILSRPYRRQHLQRRLNNFLQLEETAILREEASRDALTGVYNRVVCEEKIADYMSDQSTKQQQAALLMLDLDDFKLVNDAYGHLRGDAVLKTVAATMLELFTQEVIISRFGGDEFAIFLKNIASPEQVLQQAEQLCAKLRNLQDRAKDITCSIGVALYPLHGQDFATLCASADVAMYRAKQTGKNHACLYDTFSLDKTQIKISSPEWLLDELVEIIYVSDAATFELLYLNKAAAELLGRQQASCLGKPCYEVFFGAKEPCSVCPRNTLNYDSFTSRIRELIVGEHKTLFLLKAKLLTWNGRPARMTVAIDITNRSQKQAVLRQVGELSPCIIKR